MDTSEAITLYTLQDLSAWEKLTVSFSQPFATVLTVHIHIQSNPILS
jgi:hypothetical protein